MKPAFLHITHQMGLWIASSAYMGKKSSSPDSMEVHILRLYLSSIVARNIPIHLDLTFREQI